jgi:hypothetical protein
MSDSVEAPVIEHATSYAVLGRWRNFYFTGWHNRAGASEMMAVYELQRRYLDQSKRRIAAISVIQRSAIGALDDDMRTAIKYAATHILPRTLVGATVVPGGGFAGAMIRSIMTGLNFIQRLPFSNKITDSLLDGCAFVAPHVDGHPSADEIDKACRAIENSIKR